METILELKNVRKSYGKKEILKGINLTVKEGEIISVLGPSGCGKSTLLNIIAGILPLNEGQVFVRDKEMSSPHKVVPIEQRNMNMVFQDFALWPHMKARDNILYGLKVRKTDKAKMQEKLKEVENLLHLKGLLDQYPAELSGGQQQRVAIARALVTNPSIILLDEPLCNLDVQLRIEMRTEMAQLFRQLKTTVFHVTHDPSEAFAMADRIIVMNNGVIDQIATPAECYQSPRTVTVAGLLGAGNCIHGAVMEGSAETDRLEGSAETDRLEDSAESSVEGITDDHAESSVKGSAEEHAESSVEDNAEEHAESSVEGSAEDHAESRLEDRAEGNVVVSLQNRRLTCKNFQNIKRGQKMLLKFRPEECIFVEKECENAIPVRVVMSSFEGGQYRVKVETDGGDTFCLLHPAFLPEKQTGFAQILPERLYAYEEISG